MEYPSWVKPHLRRRLEQEALEKSSQHKHPDAKTGPATASSQPVVSIQRGIGVVSGARVRVARPQNPDESPTWTNEMDAYDGLVLTVDYVEDDGTFMTVETDWWFSLKWIVEII